MFRDGWGCRARNHLQGSRAAAGAVLGRGGWANRSPQAKLGVGGARIGLRPEEMGGVEEPLTDMATPS